MLKNQTSRRQFLKDASLTVAGTMMVPAFLKGTSMSEFSSDGRRLIVIQLSGGNDGLNTVVPFRNDYYYKYRSRIAHNPHDVLRLNDDMALHPLMTGIKSLFDSGDLTIINNVGYPNPNRSHFRSMDIWHSASDSKEYISTGWLGRYLDNECSGCKTHAGIEISNLLDLALKGEKKKGLPLVNPQQLYSSFRGVKIEKQNTGNNEAADFLYKTIAQTKSSAEYIFKTSKNYKSKLTYPNNEFGRSMKTIAELIISGIDTQIFYASLGGFDTHYKQVGRQNNLLKMYSDAMNVFIKELKSNNQWSNTLVLTFSEFGRRVKENGSLGTDHGKANNVFIMGGNLKRKGFYNNPPDLLNLDNGDLKHEIDFRQVYSTILDKWLKADADTILLNKYERLKFI